jgi:hypothetical protein
MRKVLLALAGLVVVFVVAAVLLFAAAGPSTDVPLELAKALVNLTVAVLITGVLSYVLTQRATRKAQLDDRARVLASALQNLKAGYEHVQVARFFLMAHPTGRTFTEQIANLMEARTYLHRVQRERFVLGTEVDDHVQEMLDYVSDLADEYRHNYTRVVDDVLREERARRRVLEGIDDHLMDIPLLSAEGFPKIAALIDESWWGNNSLHRAYRLSKKKIQDWLDESSRLS